MTAADVIHELRTVCGMPDLSPERITNIFTDHAAADAHVLGPTELVARLPNAGVWVTFTIV